MWKDKALAVESKIADASASPVSHNSNRFNDTSTATEAFLGITGFLLVPL